MTMTLRVPVEIIEQIIQNVSRSDLISCALISHDFLIPSQQLLFRYVTLSFIDFDEDTRTIGMTRYSSFQSAVASAPELALFVREFSLIQYGKAKVLTDMPTFPGMLMSFRNLTKFRLHSYSGSNYENLSPALKEALIAVFRSHLITNISLQGLLNISPDTMKWIKSISTVELGYITFAEQSEKSNQLDTGTECTSIKTLILGNQELDSSKPLLNAMSSSRTKLEKLEIRSVSHSYEIEVAREIIEKQKNSLTTLEFSSGFLNYSSDYKLIDFNDIPHLRTVRFSAEFYSASSISGLSNVNCIFSKVREDNSIQQVTIEVIPDSLADLTKDFGDWEILDMLLSGSTFPYLQKVDFRYCRHQLYRCKGKVPGGAETLKNILEGLLPRLKNNGKLYLNDIAVIDQLEFRY
ncbi:hypothetical protein BDQ17DRAFT_1374117 [Cyathus striatus]|nr:hypothetical protein BDQ17DRAFT_1374117 [Cyathus striatus]